MSITAQQYLNETEPAVMDFFASLSRYNRMYDQLWDMKPDLMEEYRDEQTGQMMQRSRQPTADEQAQLQRYLSHAQECFGYRFSEAVLCGSILQIAFMGIRLFSQNTKIPASCATLVDPIDDQRTELHSDVLLERERRLDHLVDRCGLGQRDEHDLAAFGIVQQFEYVV